ncbi:hypothetical protein LCGC14_0642940 [marine sediment metagenome]|uniref:Uncharacterized protein n=1 Tax=marine sediment metagenome TaxID=412755 RepID=A0A0F9R3Q3_9ZZZZ|nr:hypothetical protein [Candidatus Aminicenantes bacterium]
MEDPAIDPCQSIETIFPERDNQIAYLYFFAGLNQTQIAKQYDLTKQAISLIINKVKNSGDSKNRLVSTWEKEYTILSRGKALQMVKQIEPANHPKSKLALDASILVDKARLIDGESTQNVLSYHEHHLSTNELDSRILELKALKDGKS